MSDQRKYIPHVIPEHPLLLFGAAGLQPGLGPAPGGHVEGALGTEGSRGECSSHRPSARLQVEGPTGLLSESKVISPPERASGFFHGV